MTQFTTTNLVNNRVLVQGTDFLGTEGKAVLDSSQWAEINAQKSWGSATEEFDRAVEEFFKPLTDAADKIAKANDKVEDPITFVVLSEGTEGVAAEPAHLVKLTKDSIILRLLESQAYDRLAWVGDQLEILESAQSPSAPAVPTAEEVTALGAEALDQPTANG